MPSSFNIILSSALVYSTFLPVSVLVRSILCGYFQEPLHYIFNPIRKYNLRDPSHTTRPTNINVVPIDYPLRARLRGRLTLLRLALSRNPWNFGERASHPLNRYSCLHSHFRYLHGRLPFRFNGLRNAPLPLSQRLNPKLRCITLAPLHLRRRISCLDQ